MSKIVSLQAENIKRLKAITIEPSGSTVIIGGENEAGKSSVLDSIEYVFSPKDHQCAVPVRLGEEKARVVAQLDEEGIVVTRTFTKGGGGTLKVTAANGSVFQSPQAMLDKMVGRLSFDPLAFMALRPRDQADAVKDLVGVDTTDLDAERESLYSERTELGREHKSATAELKASPYHHGAPKEEVSVADLTAKLSSAFSANAAVEAAKNKRDVAAESVRRAKSDVVLLEQKLKQARAFLERASSDLETAEEVFATCDAVDTAALESALSEAEQINRQVRANDEHDSLYLKVEKLACKVSDLTSRIEKIDKEKSAMITAAKFPVDNLGFGEVGLTYNGLPLEQASSAVQLRVSVAMGLAMNPGLKVLLVRNGSLLDKKNLAMVSEMAEAAGAQIWIERVGEGDECSVIIEDGEVRS